jgi:hypothetical protein
MVIGLRSGQAAYASRLPSAAVAVDPDHPRFAPWG